ncbi:MAG: hypothetical protein KC591_02750, partial [Gemmatimonadetes bacterium]|nr:hypothetical protein [Gemmatimonadota bacterium]
TACHDHDGPSVAHDGLRLDRAIAAILGEVDLDSTLVVLLADHATDSPAFLEWAHPESLDVVSMSVERMETRIFSGPWRGTPRALEAKALPVLDEGARQTGLTSGDIDRLLVAESGYDRRTALGDAISRRLGISFIAYEDHLASSQVHGHTGELVPIRAWGRGAEAVLGIHRHDEIGRWLREVLEVGGAAEAGGDPATAADSAAAAGSRSD